jgi:hypothetical protein
LQAIQSNIAMMQSNLAKEKEEERELVMKEVKE